METVTGEKT